MMNMTKVVVLISGACTGFVMACSAAPGGQVSEQASELSAIYPNDMFYVSDNIKMDNGACLSKEQQGDARSVAASVAGTIVGTTIPLAMTESNNCTGSYSEYTDIFDALWVQELGVNWNSIYSAPGNHDYIQRGAKGFKRYFLRNPDVQKTWGSFRVGAKWRVFQLDSNVTDALMDDQVAWLTEKLNTYKPVTPCVIAYFHHPVYSSGNAHPGDRDKAARLWEVLKDKASLVLTGHEHVYERVHRDGLVQIVAGTGGAGHTGFGDPIEGSQARIPDVFGSVQVTVTEGGPGEGSYFAVFSDTSGAARDMVGDVCRVW